jgi:hypothetical protein
MNICIREYGLSICQIIFGDSLLLLFVNFMKIEKSGKIMELFCPIPVKKHYLYGWF